MIEILVIAALISLFSALAIFSMVYLVDSSKRKATIADTSTLGKALCAVHMEFNFFPKIGYLSLPLVELQRSGLTATALPPDFDALGFNSIPHMSRKIVSDWLGPYLPNPVPRQTVSPGYKGYTTRVRMPSDPSKVLNWPADPWGSPYVVYLIHLDSGSQAVPRWIRSPMESANYIALVVSYGKNRIPGGLNDITNLTQADRNLADSVRLFRELTHENADFEALPARDYTDQLRGQSLLLPLHNARGWQDAGFAGGGYLSDPDQPGILDSGSDDLVFQIP